MIWQIEIKCACGAELKVASAQSGNWCESQAERFEERHKQCPGLLLGKKSEKEKTA